MPLTADQKKAVLDAWGKPGTTARSIAAELNLPYTQVRYTIRRARDTKKIARRTRWGDAVKAYYDAHPEARQQAAERAAAVWNNPASAQKRRDAIRRAARSRESV